MEKIKKYYSRSVIMAAVFLVYTILVVVVDVQPIGINGTDVGFATINSAVFSFLGVSEFWTMVTKILALFPFAACTFFALYGLRQLIKGKSFKAVSNEIWVMACFYLLCFIFYFFFEIVVINYRPVLDDGELAASFPSSHTVFVLCAMISAMPMMDILFPERKLLIACVDVFCVLVSVLMVLGRFASGVHWFSDIIGGVILSATLLSAFNGTLRMVRENPDKD